MVNLTFRDPHLQEKHRGGGCGRRRPEEREEGVVRSITTMRAVLTPGNRHVRGTHSKKLLEEGMSEQEVSKEGEREWSQVEHCWWGKSEERAPESRRSSSEVEERSDS